MDFFDELRERLKNPGKLLIEQGWKRPARSVIEIVPTKTEVSDVVKTVKDNVVSVRVYKGIKEAPCCKIGLTWDNTWDMYFCNKCDTFYVLEGDKLVEYNGAKDQEDTSDDVKKASDVHKGCIGPGCDYCDSLAHAILRDESQSIDGGPDTLVDFYRLAELGGEG